MERRAKMLTDASKKCHRSVAEPPPASPLLNGARLPKAARADYNLGTRSPVGKALDGDAHGDLIRRLRGKIDPTRRITPCRSWPRSRHPDKGGPGESYTERDREASGGDRRWAVMLSAHHLTRVAPRPLTPLPSLPQPHPRLIPVRDLSPKRNTDYPGFCCPRWCRSAS